MLLAQNSSRIDATDKRTASLAELTRRNVRPKAILYVFLQKANKRKRLQKFRPTNVNMKEPRISDGPESEIFHGMLLQNLEYLDGRHFGDGAPTGHKGRRDMRNAMFESYDQDQFRKNPQRLNDYGRQVFDELAKVMKLDVHVEDRLDKLLGRLPPPKKVAKARPNKKQKRVTYEQWQARAKNGDGHAHYMLGLIPRKNRSREQRFAHFEAAYEAGYLPASGQLAEFLIRGVGTKKDSARAVSVLGEAGRRGFPGGYFHLGALYGGAVSYKSDIIVDQTSAVRNYRDCIALDGKVKQFADKAKFEFRRCYTNLGRHNMLGKGTEKNLVRARELFAKGVELGEPIAMYYLGFRYIFGEGGKPDFNRGIELLNRSADLGNKGAARSIRKLEESMKRKLRRPSRG